MMMVMIFFCRSISVLNLLDDLNDEFMVKYVKLIEGFI